MTGAYVTSTGDEYRGFHQCPNVLRDVYMKKIGVDGYGFLNYLISWANSGTTLSQRRMKSDLKVSQDKLERIQRVVLDQCGHFVAVSPGDRLTANRWHLDMRQVWAENAAHLARGHQSAPVPEIGTPLPGPAFPVPEIGTPRTGNRYTPVPEIGTSKDITNTTKNKEQKDTQHSAADAAQPVQTGPFSQPKTEDPTPEPVQASVKLEGTPETPDTLVLETVPPAPPAAPKPAKAPKPTPAETTEFQAAFTVLATICLGGLEGMTNPARGRVGTAAKGLLKAGYTPDEIAQIGAWVKARDASWRTDFSPQLIENEAPKWRNAAKIKPATNPYLATETFDTGPAPTPALNPYLATETFSNGPVEN